MVEALQSRGHTVAMTGDGVNDVLALKKADMGIAMGTGTAAAQAVSQLVLVDSRFSTLPGVVAEGRRVTANIERVAVCSPTRRVGRSLALASAGGVPYLILPRHLTIIDSLTIGIPGFFQSLPPTGAGSWPESSTEWPASSPDGLLRPSPCSPHISCCAEPAPVCSRRRPWRPSSSSSSACG
jgi:magnesium-transporting ATPase (P-type)